MDLSSARSSSKAVEDLLLTLSEAIDALRTRQLAGVLEIVGTMGMMMPHFFISIVLRSQTFGTRNLSWRQKLGRVAVNHPQFAAARVTSES